MSLREDLAFVKVNYPILDLVREYQTSLYGEHAHGCVSPEQDRDQKTRCVVHEEAQPSAKAYVRSNSLYCFVCGRTWDPVGLVMALEDVSMPIAVRRLMEELGLRPPQAVNLDAAIAKLAPRVEVFTGDQYRAWAGRVWLWATEWAPVYPWLDDIRELLDEWGFPPEEPETARASVLEAVRWAGRIAAVYGLPVPPVPPSEDAEWKLLTGT